MNLSMWYTRIRLRTAPSAAGVAMAARSEGGESVERGALSKMCVRACYRESKVDGAYHGGSAGTYAR